MNKILHSTLHIFNKFDIVTTKELVYTIDSGLLTEFEYNMYMFLWICIKLVRMFNVSVQIMRNYEVEK